MADSFDSVWQDLKVSDKGIRLEFTLGQHIFWIRKEKGLMRFLVGSEKLLNASVCDSLGIAEGIYDNLIDRLMMNVSVQIDDAVIDFDADWRESVIPEFPDDDAIYFLSDLPLSVAAVILGERGAALALGGGLRSLISMQEQGTKEA